MAEKLTVDLLIAEHGLRNDVRDGQHLVSAVFSTDWLDAKHSAALLSLLGEGRVKATLELPDAVPEAPKKEGGKRVASS